MDVRPGIDWPQWRERWDRQQEGYVPDREARFTAMFDALEALLPADFVALDLDSGPGSLSRRLPPEGVQVLSDRVLMVIR